MKTKETAFPEQDNAGSMENAARPEEAAPENKGQEPASPENDPATRGRLSLRRLQDMTVEEDETPVNLSWRTILGGDILASGWLRRQFWMIILITAFTIIYVGNRYACQQEAIEQSRLSDTLLDRKYKALTRSSELLEKTLRSNIEEELADSTIQTSITPLYGIKTDE